MALAAGSVKVMVKIRYCVLSVVRLLTFLVVNRCLLTNGTVGFVEISNDAICQFCDNMGIG